MASSNEYPPEKTAIPSQSADTPHYPPPPATAAAAGTPLHQSAPQSAPLATGAQEEHFPPPPPGPPPNYVAGTNDEKHSIPPHPTAEAPYQPYQPTSWTPEQQQYNAHPTPTGTEIPAGVGAPTDATQQGKISAWDKTRSTSKAGFDKLWAGFEKLGVPVNKFSNKIGSEAFWPQTLDKESDKCARILKSFCKDGFYTERPTDVNAPQDGPKGKPKVLVKIPQKVINNAVGLAIFTTMRAGLWVSGSGGSGVLVARLPDGSWSPPSGLLIHTIGAGFMAGIDIYDCVLVINTPEALAAFQRVRLSLGGEVSVAAGPVGIGGVGELSITGDDGKNRKPVFAYMKSRGLYAGVQVDGTIVLERNDENARFYGQRLPAAAIVGGKLGANVPHTTRLLTEVLKEAEGRKDVNQSVLSEVHEVPPPGDMDVEKRTEPSQDLKDKFAHEGGDAARYA